MSYDISKLKILAVQKPAFKSVLPQLYFEFAELASAKMWREIQSIVDYSRNAFKAGFNPA